MKASFYNTSNRDGSISEDFIKQQNTMLINFLSEFYAEAYNEDIEYPIETIERRYNDLAIDLIGNQSENPPHFEEQNGNQSNGPFGALPSYTRNQ
jgi:hypothetical protein